MASSLLILIDDIASVMDDVAVVSKVAAKKTVGVLGDDLALNAEQVSGVRANRELPVVWAVAKGSFLNKLILVPSALMISLIYPPLIIMLLVLGGLYLCFEGFEKIAHKLLHNAKDTAEERQALRKALLDNEVDLANVEKDKIRGAIRTDFVLSAEIIVIILGTVSEESILNQSITLSLLAIAFTVGVYGFVAMIVKLDDLGLFLFKQGVKSVSATLKAIGKALLVFAPLLMKGLAIVGTAAMFLVGGGILSHHVGFIHHLVETLLHWSEHFPSMVSSALSVAVTLIIGLIAGGVMLPVAKLVGNLKKWVFQRSSKTS